MNQHKLGIGIDIVEIKRFSNMDLNNKGYFLEKIFTKDELEYCYSHGDAASHLASTYSGKEATIKAMENINIRHLDYRDIAILRNEHGMPFVQLHDSNLNKLCINISLSHDNGSAIAFVIIQQGEACTGNDASGK